MDRAEGILVGQCQGTTHRAVFFRVRGTRIVSDGLHRAGAHINLHDAFPFRPRVEIPQENFFRREKAGTGKADSGIIDLRPA